MIKKRWCHYFFTYDIIFSFVCRHQAEKKIRLLPEIDGLSKDTVVTSWMAKYDALMKGEKYTFMHNMKKLKMTDLLLSIFSYDPL